MTKSNTSPRRSRRWRIALGLLVVAGLALAAALRPPAVAVGGDPASRRDAPMLSGPQAPVPHTILVMGASKGVGEAIVSTALARGHRVIGLARSPQPAGLTGDRLQWIQGDAADVAMWSRSADAADAIVITLGVPVRTKNVTLFSTVTRLVLERIADRPEVRLVAITGIGAGSSRGHGGWGYDYVVQPWLLGSAYQDKTLQETLLRDSAANFTIVRPGFLVDDEVMRPYWVLTDVRGVRAGSIARRQVAEFIVASLEQNLYSRDTVLLSR